jgi:hypothetical protein
MMAKARTIYVYKTSKRFVDAMAAQKPVAGILIENGSGNVATLDFFASFERQETVWVGQRFHLMILWERM